MWGTKVVLRMVDENKLIVFGGQVAAIGLLVALWWQNVDADTSVGPYLVWGVMLLVLNMVCPVAVMTSMPLFRHPTTSAKLLVRGIITLVAHHKWTILFSLTCGLIGSTNAFITNIVWWFGLGVLASIGLGTGVPTGLLWLFPLILRTALNNGPARVWDSLWELYVPTYVWGFGTAFGELPPYYMAKTMQIETNETIQRIERQIKGIVKKYGFWGIMFLSSYPNAFFDMCGIMCGRYGIPVTTFLGATIAGKVFVKTTIQLHVLVLSAHADYFFSFLPPLYRVWLMDCVTQLVSTTEPTLPPHWLLTLGTTVWKNTIITFLVFFVVHFLNSIVVHNMSPPASVAPSASLPNHQNSDHNSNK